MIVVEMLITIIIVALLSAYYFGLRMGGISAVLTLFLLVIAAFFPPFRLIAYLLFGLFVLAILVLGPKQPGAKKRKRLIEAIKTMLSKLLKRFF